MLLDSLKWILVLYICDMSCILFVDRNRYKCVRRVPILKKLGKYAIARVLLLANNDLRNDPCSSYLYCCPTFCRNRFQKVKNRSSPNWRKHWRRWGRKRQKLVKARSAIWWCRNPADCFTAVAIFLLKEMRFSVIFPSIGKVSTSHAYQCPMMMISLVGAADQQSVNEVWIRWVVEYYSSFLHFRED